MEPGHFEFEAKLMVWLVVAFFAFSLLAGLALPWLMDHVEVDKCLDAGGAYDDQRDICVVE